MATDPDRIFVAGEAHLYIGPVTAVPPEDPAADFGPELIEVGYFTGDSLRFAHTTTLEPVTAHQSNWPAVYVQTSAESTVEAELQEWSAGNFRLAFGGGRVTEDSPGIWRFSPPQIWEEYEFMAVVRCRDGARSYALVIPRATNIGGADLALGKGSAAVLPVQITASGDEETSRWYWITDDQAAWGEPGGTAEPGLLAWYRAGDAAGTEDSDVISLPSALPGGPTLTAAFDEKPVLRLDSLAGGQGIEFISSHPGGYGAGRGGPLAVPVSPPLYELITTAGCTIFIAARVTTGNGAIWAMFGPEAAGVTAAPGLFVGADPPGDGSYILRTYDYAAAGVAELHEWRYSQDGVAYRRGGVDQAEATAEDSGPILGRDPVVTYSNADEVAIALGNGLNGIFYDIRIYSGVLAGAALQAARDYYASTYGLDPGPPDPPLPSLSLYPSTSLYP